MRPLTLFISHSSEVFTDHAPHGDGLVAYTIVTLLAGRGHRLHVAAQKVDLKGALPANIILHPIFPRTSSYLLQRFDYAMRSRFLFNRLLRTERFDIIHQLNPVFAGLSLGLIGFEQPLVLGPYAARWPNDPNGVTSDGGLMARVLGFLRDRLASLQQQQAAAILLTTPAAENQIPDLSEVADRIHLLPFGTDAAIFAPAPDWDQPRRVAEEQERPVILFLANVNRRKGIFHLLEAFVAVAREFPTVLLRIVGGGDDLEAAKRIAAASPVSAQIEFLPPVSRAETISLYQGCTIFCVPSLGEPFGMAVMEAMSCARPIVTTAAGGPAYTVLPEGGVLIPTANPPAIAGALLRLLHDPEQRMRMGRFNQHRIATELSWDTILSKLEAVYAKVAGL